MSTPPSHIGTVFQLVHHHQFQRNYSRLDSHGAIAHLADKKCLYSHRLQYTVAFVIGTDESTYLTGCISYWYCEDDFVKEAKDGEQCTGLGCCQTTSIPAKLKQLDVTWGSNSSSAVYNPAWEYSPCSYARLRTWRPKPGTIRTYINSEYILALLVQ